MGALKPRVRRTPINTRAGRPPVHPHHQDHHTVLSLNSSPTVGDSGITNRITVRASWPSTAPCGDDYELLIVGYRAQFVTTKHVPGERRRFTITIDEWLLRVADEAAEAVALTRSGFIERTLEAAADSAPSA